jgi:hypothetical protein
MLRDFQLPEAQSLDDLDHLLAFGAEVGVMHVVYSVAKIVRPRSGRLSPVMQNLKQVYQHLASPGRILFRGGSWRLPPETAEQYVTQPFLELCQRHGLAAQFCKQNLLATP